MHCFSCSIHVESIACSKAHVLARGQVVSPAVQPRALWVVAHHWQAAARMDAGWMHLLRALAAALSGNEDAAKARRCAHCSASPVLLSAHPCVVPHSTAQLALPASAIAHCGLRMHGTATCTHGNNEWLDACRKGGRL